MSLRANIPAIGQALGGEPLLSLAPTPPSAAASVTPSLLATRATPPAPPQLTLHIGRLALHGYSRNEASLLVQGLERGLQQLLAQQRAWPAIAQQLPQLRLPACDWRAAERPEQRGQRLALLLAQGLEGLI